MPDVFTVFLNKDDDDDDEPLRKLYPSPNPPSPPPPLPWDVINVRSLSSSQVYHYETRLVYKYIQ